MRNRKPNGHSVKSWARHLAHKGCVTIRCHKPEKYLHSSRRNADG